MKSLLAKRFGHLTVTEFAYIAANGAAYWKCQCDCGKKSLVASTNLGSGRTRSCGHLKKEARLKFSRTIARKQGHECADTLDDALDELGALA